MRMFDKRAMAVAASLLASSAASAADVARHAMPRQAASRHLTVHGRPVRPQAAALGVAVAPGLTFATPFTVVAGEPASVVRVPHYIGPDGTYDEYADLVKSIEGTPCGQDCTRRSLLRWGYAPAD